MTKGDSNQRQQTAVTGDSRQHTLGTFSSCTGISNQQQLANWQQRPAVTIANDDWRQRPETSKN